LVELLVVIGIIAVLISFLMPALQRAHDRAVKISCANNERQLFFSLQLYSYSSHDYIPLGYDWYAGSNYVSYAGQLPTHPLQMIGLLDNLNLLSNPSIAFCPAEVDPIFLYNTPQNPWLSSNQSYPNACVGYGTRPDSDWEAALTQPSDMPKLTKLPPHTAVLADTFPLWSALATRHMDGVNVCYSDGSVNYVLAKPTLLPLQQIVTNYDYHNLNDSLTVASFNSYFLNYSVTPNTGIWAAFDGY
jgi:prepilin-type processing-associated H-X9-DG protein